MDDVTVGIRSTALLFSEKTRPILTGFTLSTVSLIGYAGMLNAQGPAFYAGLTFAGIQLARILRRTNFDDRASCASGFKDSHWSGFWVWMGALVDYLLLMLA